MGSMRRQRINGGLQALARRHKVAGTVDVGIIDAGLHDDSTLTVAEIGYLNEFGIGVPERSFMRSTRFDKENELIDLQKQLLKKINNGSIDKEQALGLIGEFFKGEIQQKIIDIRTPINSEATIRKKGSSNPLIDTGQLKNSITYEVNVE